MHRFFLLLVILCFGAYAGQSGPTIAVQNAILAKIEEQTISVIDVKKKMDLAFHRMYPQLIDSQEARYQFYEASWRRVLTEMIDEQLILADAAEKNIPLSDGEVREEMENRFGPSIMFTLDKIGLTYDEAWKMVKNELMVQRMTWWFIHARALSQVTPYDIRQAFRSHLKENPAFEEWKYQVVAVRGENAEEIAQEIHKSLTSHKISLDKVVELDSSIQLSNEFSATDRELSDAHRVPLSLLLPGEYSPPILQKSKIDGKSVARIFHLKEKSFHPAPEFDHMSAQLRNELVQKAVGEAAKSYLGKLRKNHSFYEKVPEDLHPFSLQ